MQRVQNMLILPMSLCIVFTVCQPTGGSAEPPGSLVDLVGTRWQLASLDGVTPLAGTRIMLTFDQGSLGGFAGCNGYGGPATWTNDGLLTITEIAMTEQACGEPTGVMEQEETYIGALQLAATYHVQGDKLEIEDASGETTLVFTLDPQEEMNPADLIDTRWALVTMNGDELLEGSILTLSFESGSDYSGHAGCRDFIGSYEAERDTITFYSMSMVGHEACLADQVLFDQEHSYIDLISTATTYRLSEGRLAITTARGETLQFES